MSLACQRSYQIVIDPAPPGPYVPTGFPYTTIASAWPNDTYPGLGSPWTATAWPGRWGQPTLVPIVGPYWSQADNWSNGVISVHLSSYMYVGVDDIWTFDFFEEFPGGGYYKAYRTAQYKQNSGAPHTTDWRGAYTQVAHSEHDQPVWSLPTPTAFPGSLTVVEV